MKADQAGARISKHPYQRVDGLNHKMHVNGRRDAVVAKREALVAAMADMPLVPSDAKDAAAIESAWDAFVSLYHEICRLKTLGGTLGRVADMWDGIKDKKKKKKRK